jgi:hypothetical protein
VALALLSLVELVKKTVEMVICANSTKMDTETVFFGAVLHKLAFFGYDGVVCSCVKVFVR